MIEFLNRRYRLLRLGSMLGPPDVDDYRNIMAFSKTAAVVALAPLLLAYFSVNASGPVMTTWILGSTLIYGALCYVSFLFDIERFNRATAKFKNIILAYVCVAAIPWMVFPWAIQFSSGVTQSDVVISTLACAGVSWGAVFMICRVMQVSMIFSLGVIGSLVTALAYTNDPECRGLIPWVVMFHAIMMMFGIKAGSVGRQRDRVFNKLQSSEKRATRIAYTDPVTKLPNRAAFNRDIEFLLDRQYPEKDNFTLAIMDLDLFKNVNDTHGHQTGDKVLQEISRRVTDELPHEWKFFRMGGDEFAFIAPDCNTALHREILAKITTAISEPFIFDTLKLELSASIGFACYPDHVDDHETVLSAAEIALRDAKRSHNGDARIFDASLSQTHAEVLEMDAEIRRNLELDLFEIHYQPQICFKSGRLRGLEALTRLKSETGSLLNTQSVFEVAELRGLSQTLSRKIFAKVGEDLPEIMNNTDADTTVSINICPADLRAGSPLLEILEQWKLDGIPVNRVRIELTEECVIGRGSSGAQKFLQSISELGYTLSLDDFGTGHASLANLRTLAIDELKIDKQFVDNIGDKKNEGILSGIIDLADNMGISCVVEGIETSDQFLRLNFMKAQVGQGYYWSKPVPLAELMDGYLSADTNQMVDQEDMPKRAAS